MLMVGSLVRLALANVQKNSPMDALAFLFDLKLTSHNFFKFFKKRLRQFFGRAGNQAAAKLGDFAAGFRFCAVMKNGCRSRQIATPRLCAPRWTCPTFASR